MTSFEARWRAREAGYGDALPPARIISINGSFLPDSAAPFLDFGAASRPAPIYEVFGVRSDWSEDDRRRLGGFVVIGSDGEGNPVCLDSLGKIILLDHEDGFRKSLFLNSGLAQLSECLLAYFGETNAERFRAEVARIDAPALEPGSFWWQEALNLAASR
jgi:hypothetical protein